MANKYSYAIGRRKTSSAQVKLFDGATESTINWKKISEYVSRDDLFEVLYRPLKVTWLKDTTYFEVKVSGSWESSQAQAIALGLSRALLLRDETLRPVLKAAGLLTRDARKVERKKPGLKKARKSPSWSKR